MLEDRQGPDVEVEGRGRHFWRVFRWILLAVLLSTLFLWVGQQTADIPFTVEGNSQPRSQADYGPWEEARFRPLRSEAAGAAEGEGRRELSPLNFCFLLPGCE